MTQKHYEIVTGSYLKYKYNEVFTTNQKTPNLKKKAVECWQTFLWRV